MVDIRYPFISVIIPVFNDVESLGNCLGALSKQTYPKSCFEIVVIDNGSDSVDSVWELTSKFDNIVFDRELMPGSYAARNKGIESSKGEILAFTDADCIPSPSWLENGIAYFSGQENYDMVIGRIDVLSPEEKTPNLVELYQIVIAFPQEQHLKQFKAGATANVMIRRSVIRTVGKFNHRLKSFGDFDLGHRIHTAGFAQVYGDDVVVSHPTRGNWADLRKRFIRIAGGRYDYYIRSEKHFIKKQFKLLRMVIFDLIPPVNFTVYAWQEPRLMSLRQKLGVPMILWLIRLISLIETLRLWAGGSSTRA